MTIASAATIYTPTNNRTGRCPSCGQQTRFRFVGEQRWPVQVALKMNLPSVMRLYVCNHCASSVSEQSLAL